MATPHNPDPPERLELLVGSPFRNERNRHINICNIYLQMGSMRSLSKLHQRLTDTARTQGGRVPTLRSIKEWSSQFDWQQRAVDYDKRQTETVEAQAQEFRQKHLFEGLALAHNRIARLTVVEELLFAQISDNDCLWPPELKNIRTEDGSFSTTEIRRFNGPLVQQYRGVLDDIAKEVGDRKERVLHGGDPDSPGLEMNLTTHLDSVRQLKEKAAQELEDFDPYGNEGERTNPFDEGESE